jgi:hypothetical protein
MESNNWTERQDEILRIVSPEIVPEKLGRSLDSILARRDVLGLPAYESKRNRYQREDKLSFPTRKHSRLAS